MYTDRKFRQLVCPLPWWSASESIVVSAFTAYASNGEWYFACSSLYPPAVLPTEEMSCDVSCPRQTRFQVHDHNGPPNRIRQHQDHSQRLHLQKHSAIQLLYQSNAFVSLRTLSGARSAAHVISAFDRKGRVSTSV